MLFQNTSVTRGTGTIVVTATGQRTQMGQIATMLSSVTRKRSPLQKELDTFERRTPKSAEAHKKNLKRTHAKASSY